jgi:hypothetical protein
MSYTQKYQDEINESFRKKIQLRSELNKKGNHDIILKIDGREYDYGQVIKDWGDEKWINVQAQIPVKFEITVDTKPFDKGIIETNKHVDLLTKSVVNTEAAQIAAKIKSAERISTTVVSGFYGLIKSEINQQISEIKPRVESLLTEMHHQRDACLSKKQQLASDFERITERYTKIFQELDKELRKRILLLNQAAIQVQASLSQQVHGALADASTGIATVFHTEGSAIHANLFSSGAKGRAVALLNSGKNYLKHERNLSGQLKESLHLQAVSSLREQYVPVIFMASSDAPREVQARIFVPDQLSALSREKSQLIRAFEQEAHAWPVTDTSRLKTHFSSLLSRQQTDGQPRIAAQIQQLWAHHQTISSNQ